MELIVGKAELQKELQLCQGVVEKRSTIPILSNVLLKEADGRLQIAATELDVTILSSCAARVTTPGGVTIEAKRLFDIVRSLPDEDLHTLIPEGRMTFDLQQQVPVNAQQLRPAENLIVTILGAIEARDNDLRGLHDRMTF